MYSLGIFSKRKKRFYEGKLLKLTDTTKRN